MIETPFQELDVVLDKLVSGIEDSLAETLLGVYLQGSFALGDFDEHSDVDFIVVVKDSLLANQVDTLQVLHHKIYHMGAEWAKHLEGSYFPLEILRSFDRLGEELWYLDNGSSSLIRSNHCNTLLVRWVVRECGVILVGPSPKIMIDPIPKEMLRQEMSNALMMWGQRILDDPTPWSNQFYQGYIVLNWCRMFHDIHNGYPGTKRQGAEWAKKHLDAIWSPLIDEAWGSRPDPASKVREPADLIAFQNTLKFLEYVMSESKRFIANNINA
jgi:predicted nucleotidyltransferase